MFAAKWLHIRTSKLEWPREENICKSDCSLEISRLQYRFLAEPKAGKLLLISLFGWTSSSNHLVIPQSLKCGKLLKLIDVLYFPCVLWSRHATFRDDTKQARSRLPRVHAMGFNNISDIAHLQDELILISSCGLPLFSAEERKIRSRQWG